MKIAGLDTGGTNGLVIVNEAGDIVRSCACIDLSDTIATIQAHDVGLVVLERAGRSQPEYHQAKEALRISGIPIFEVSPGEWKPNPNCATRKAEHPDWSQHERDALSLIKYHYLHQTGWAWDDRFSPYAK